MYVAIAVPVLVSTGCLSVKTEHEIKPIEIHAVVDLNLKVDKQLDEAIGQSSKSDKFEAIKKLLTSGAVGLDNKSMLLPRGAISSEDMELITATNAKYKEHLAKIVADTGAKPEDVAAKGREKFVAGEFFPKGAWYQDADGTWKQK